MPITAKTESPKLVWGMNTRTTYRVLKYVNIWTVLGWKCVKLLTIWCFYFQEKINQILGLLIFFFNFALLFVVYDMTSWVRKCHIAVSFFVYISLWRNNYLPNGCSMNRYFPKGLSGKFKTYTIKAQTNAFSKNVNISNKLWFIERCSLITATVCANKFS